jgi:hypothetical protein
MRVPGRSVPVSLNCTGINFLSLRRMMSDWKVELVNDSVNELYVEFQGPKDSEHCPFILCTAVMV